MRRCYVVPGLAGTSLYTDPSFTAKTWVNYAELALGNVGRLRLAADGVSPGAPDGVQLYANEPLPDYYGSATASLARALAPHDYNVANHGYDWRLSSRITGPQLADRIRGEVTAADPCSLVCHSFGGIVARLAWRDLARTGETALVRRIVTLGTPHWGSYGLVRVWSLDLELLDQLYYLSLVSGAYYGYFAALALGKLWTPTRIVQLISTWPSFYESLPSLLAPDAADDPHREAIYTGAWPVDRGVSAAHLSDAKDVFQPLLASADATPPTWVLTTVGGDGFPTVDRLAFPALLGRPESYHRSDSGDGTVTKASAVISNSAAITLTGAHGDLPVISAGFPAAAAVILEERAPPAPPPPVQVVPGVFPFQLHGPPAPVFLFGWKDP